MSNYRNVLQEIERLEAMVPSKFGKHKWDFGAIWNQIKITENAFKGVRFPTKEEREIAWNDFQNLIGKVKEKQEQMQDKVLEEIQTLKAMIPAGLIGEDKWDFGAIWRQIRTTQSAFKGVRFPTKQEHEIAWNDFQKLIDKVEKKQEDNRKQSAALRDRMIGQANSIALTDDSWVIAILTLGISEIIKGIIEGKKRPSYENQRQILQAASKKLKNLWDLFGTEKAKLLREDKEAVYRAFKKVQSRLNDEWAKFKEIQARISAKSRDKVVGMARAAMPPTSFEKVIETTIFAFVTEGLSLLLEFCDDKKTELQVYGKKLKEARNCFHKEKIHLLRHDKDTAYKALKEAEAKLNAAWAELRGQKAKAMEKYHADRRERQQAWRNRVEQNREKNRQRRSKIGRVLEHKRQNLERNRHRYSKLEGILEHKKHTHLNELYEKQNDARSDSYRERVEGWIEEELKNIQDIERKLKDIDGWIREDSDSIQDIERKLKDIDGWIREDSDSIQDIERKLKDIDGWIREAESKLNN